MLIMVALTLGLEPFVSEPHLIEKVCTMFEGTLTQMIDWLDLLMHGTPWLLPIMGLIRRRSSFEQ